MAKMSKKMMDIRGELDDVTEALKDIQAAMDARNGGQLSPYFTLTIDGLQDWLDTLITKTRMVMEMDTLITQSVMATETDDDAEKLMAALESQLKELKGSYKNGSATARTVELCPKIIDTIKAHLPK